MVGFNLSWQFGWWLGSLGVLVGFRFLGTQVGTWVVWLVAWFSRCPCWLSVPRHAGWDMGGLVGGLVLSVSLLAFGS